MVRAWYHDGVDTVHRSQPHMTQPVKFVSWEEFRKLTGTEYFQFDADTVDSNEDYQKLKELRGYKNEDCVALTRQSFPNFDEKTESFYKEHMHTNDEVRFICDGSGYFDVKCVGSDKWIRIETVKNDLLIVPRGIYHRFTLDTNEYIKVRRLSTESLSSSPIHRPEGDTHPTRLQYLRDMGVKA